MIAPFELLEHVPLPVYLFRLADDDFVLEDVNAAALAQNPSLATLRGRPMAGLYKDQPQALLDAQRAVRERTTVVRELTVRRYARTEATQQLRLTFTWAPPSHLLIFMQDVATPDMATTALRESEARYRSLVASLPEA